MSIITKNERKTKTNLVDVEGFCDVRASGDELGVRNGLRGFTFCIFLFNRLTGDDVEFVAEVVVVVGGGELIKC